MKKYRPLFLISYILIGGALLSFSCNSTKTPSAQNFIMMITLKDGLSDKHISKNYQAYAPTDIRKANKTLNQYEVNFSCSDAMYIKLQNELTNDPVVIQFKNPKSTKNNIQTGRNDAHGKSKPIRKNK